MRRFDPDPRLQLLDLKLNGSCNYRGCLACTYFVLMVGCTDTLTPVCP